MVKSRERNGQNKPLDVFPFDPPAWREGAVHIISNDDITSERDIYHLKLLTHDYPERDFFVFVKDGEQANKYILNAKEKGYILFVEVIRDFCKHPKSKSEYVRIRKDSGF